MEEKDFSEIKWSSWELEWNYERKVMSLCNIDD